MPRIATTIGAASLAAAGIAGLAIATGSGAQPEGSQGQPTTEEMMEAWEEAGQITDEHRALWDMEGEWDFEATFSMGEGQEFSSTGTVTIERLYEGRFVKMEVDGQSDWGPWQGLGFMGYNNITGQYQSTWMDSMATLIGMSEGYRTGENSWVFWGEHANPMGDGKIRSREVIEMDGEDRMTMRFYQAYPGQAEMVDSGTITYTRKGD